MERAPCWTSKKRVHDDQYLDDSWEERAFAEDAAGLLGGCVWPPRSYTCSFCKREFRSAQALGGHMNVHRRDRARLKQFSSSSPNNQILDPGQNSAYFCKDPVTSCPLMVTYPTQHNYALVHDGNPNPNSHHPTAVSIPPKMSTPISKENKVISKHIFNPHIASCFVLNHEKKYPSFTSLDNEFVGKYKELGCRCDKQHERSSLSINLVFQRSFPTTIAAADDQQDEANLQKRRKLAVSPEPVIPTMSGVCMVDGGSSNVVGLKSSSLQELDLELRLGSQPI